MRRVSERLLPVAIGAAIAVAGVAGAVAILDVDSGGSSSATQTIDSIAVRPDGEPPREARSASAVDSQPRASARPSSLLQPGAAQSWQALSETMPARVGLAVVPLGPGSMRNFGPLQLGHAWSSIKAPIVVTLMRERDGERLSPEESEWARLALTASDNAAAASLFGRIEEAHGGVPGASLAVQDVLRESADTSTTVATEPPPPGAVSSYGQTEWSLPASVEFFRALGRGCLVNSVDTEYLLGLMEEVIPEQRWGLGEAGFPPSWRVSMKGGWGPEESAAGPYLVRQSGVLRDSDSGVAVAMMAEADSGSFAAGVEAMNQIATWLRENLRGLGSPSESRC